MIINFSVAKYIFEVRLTIGEMHDTKKDVTYKFEAEPSGSTYYLRSVGNGDQYIPLKAYRDAAEHLFEFSEAPANQVCVEFSKDEQIFIRHRNCIDETLMRILINPSTVQVYW